MLVFHNKNKVALITIFVQSETEHYGTFPCFALSYFRVATRVKHFMIDQTMSGKYIVVGEPKVHKSLAALVEFHKKVSKALSQLECRRVVARKYLQAIQGSGVSPGRHWCCRLRMGLPMVVHPNRQLIGWAGAGYFPESYSITENTVNTNVSL